MSRQVLKKKRRPLTPEQLGLKGEALFETICPDAGLVANKSRVDQTGWDYLVDFPYAEAGPTTSLDKRPHPIECKIQVKTIWSDGDHVELKLSAAEYLARSRGPSLIIVMSVKEDGQCDSIFAFHMLDENLGRVLERLRKAQASNSLQINKSTITYRTSNATKIPFSGKQLAEHILKFCGSDLDAYYARKADQKKNLRFATYRYHAEFTLRADSEQDVDKVFLGVREGNVVDFQTSEVRFGIKLPEIYSSEARIRIIPKQAAKCRLVITARHSAVPLKIDADIYFPPLRTEHRSPVFKVSNDVLEIVIDGADAQITYKYSFESELHIDVLITALRFNLLMMSGQGHLEILWKGKPIYGGNFEYAADQTNSEIVDGRVSLMAALKRILNTDNIRQRVVSLGQAIHNHRDILFLDNLIRDEKSAKINPLKFTRVAKAPELYGACEGVLVRRIMLSGVAIAYYAIVETNIVRTDSDTTIEFNRVSLRDISQIASDSDSYAEYCEEAKQTTGLSLSLFMNP